MNRFDEGADLPRNRNVSPWNNRANVTESKNNHAYHTQYKKFFDKECGQK